MEVAARFAISRPVGAVDAAGLQSSDQPKQAALAVNTQDAVGTSTWFCFRCGKPLEAITWAEQALALNPWDVELLLLRGRCLEAAGNVAGAFSSYTAATSNSPNHVPSLMALASLYKAKGMLDDSAAVLRKALTACEAGSISSSRSSSRASSSTELPSAADSSSTSAAAGTDASGSCATAGDGGGQGPAAGAVVPLSAVQEALAVVLTDLGTRSKNSGKQLDS